MPATLDAVAPRTRGRGARLRVHGAGERPAAIFRRRIAIDHVASRLGRRRRGSRPRRLRDAPLLAGARAAVGRDPGGHDPAELGAVLK